MSRRKYQLNQDGTPRVPFYYPYKLEDFGGDEEAMSQDLDLYADQFEEIARTLRNPHEPHPMRYPEGVDSPRYQSDLRMWESLVSQQIIHDANKPPRPISPRDPDFTALSSTNPQDVKTAKERLHNKAFYKINCGKRLL